MRKSQNLSEQFQNTVSARKSAEHKYTAFVMQCEHMKNEHFKMPREVEKQRSNLEIRANSFFTQFAEIEKEGLSEITAKEKRELRDMLGVFYDAFSTIEQECEEYVGKIHAEWQKQYLERENNALKKLNARTGDFMDTVS